MMFIQHRVNWSAALKGLPSEFGVEIDLRSDLTLHGALHVSHDPWVKGELFENWLDVFCAEKLRGPLILNTKEDGLEARILELLDERNVENFFFLDTSPPTLVKWTQQLGKKHFAVRLSAFEPLEALKPFIGKASWAWIDCFDGVPLSSEAVSQAARHFQVCLVSPELHGGPPEEIPRFKHLIPHAQAVCTKHPRCWQEIAGS